MKRTSKSHSARPARLFREPEAPADVFTAYVDGASRGNPGPASYAVIVRRPDGSAVYQLGKYLGIATNNVAEYYALIATLDYATTHGVARLRVRSDSELLVQQMRGMYKVKSAALRPLYERAQKLARQLPFFAIEHVPREQNAEADKLANRALDQKNETRKSRNDHRPLETAAPLKARASYVGGVLVPEAPLELPEGAEVELIIQPTAKK